MNSSRLFAIFLAAVCFAGDPLGAEIQSLVIRFNPSFCTGGCPQMLNDSFSKVPGVAHADTNGLQGQTNIRWKPNVPFDFWSLKRAMQAVGANYLYMTIKVRGTLQAVSNGKGYAVVSIGDNTPFQLLGPIQPNPNQYTITQSPESHPLTPYLMTQLGQGVIDNRIAVVEGPLFEPEMTPQYPYFIVIQKMWYEVTQQETAPQQ